MMTFFERHVCLQATMAVAIFACMPTAQPANGDPGGADGTWISPIQTDDNDQQRLMTFDLAQGRFVLLEFEPDSESLAADLSAMSEHVDIDDLPEGWIRKDMVRGSLDDTDSITIAYDEGCDILTVTQQANDHESTTPFIRALREDNEEHEEPTPIKEEHRTTWVGAHLLDGHLPLSDRDLYFLRIDDDDQFRLSQLDLVVIADDDITPGGFYLTVEYRGTVSADTGQLHLESFWIMSGEFELELHSEGEAIMTAHYDNQCNQLTIVGPDGNDGTMSWRFIRSVRPE